MNILQDLLLPEPAPAAETPARPSHALAQFFSALEERTHPAALHLGPVWHSTVTLLTAAGAKVHNEDPWEALSLPAEESPPTAFLETNLRYPEDSLDAMLAWDLFDYLPEDLLEPVRARLHALLKPGGLLLVLFHNRLEPAGMSRYRLASRNSFTVIPATLGLAPQRVLQNRAILDLFAPFASSRTFIGRDNLREVLLIK